ncbi:GGDEF domain-containing protein [Dendrosporobacter sp. 1207_IL3150]|uniref:GGDEF domain-containing protein n=1 Tax=Dendrosporobacter sp. 1207_IL3150 TaxID=3084054 RepID=UPI002FD8AFC8
MKLETKLRIVYLGIALAPLTVILGMTMDTFMHSDKYFNQVLAAALAAALLLGLLSPWLTARWLIGSQLANIKLFCTKVKNGEYLIELTVPNEQNHKDSENEMVSLMRDMNWMARQIYMRERVLQQTISELNHSRHEISQQKAVLEQANYELTETQMSLQQRTDELEKACQRMQVMAMTDPLTQIANRRWFFHELEREFCGLTHNSQPLSLLILDIDHFKKINDHYGHQAGDKVLVELASIIRKTVRNTDLVARIGGEEFAVLLPGTDANGAKSVAGKIQASVAATLFYSANQDLIKLTVSIGMCSLARPPFPTLDSFYNFADQALYQSKDSGRDAISIYDMQSAAICKLNCCKERGGNELCYRTRYC